MVDIQLIISTRVIAIDQWQVGPLKEAALTDAGVGAAVLSWASPGHLVHHTLVFIFF